MLVEIDIVGSSLRIARLFPQENHISRFIRTYGWINGLIQLAMRQSGAAQESQGSFTGKIWNLRFLTFTVLGKRSSHSESTPVQSRSLVSGIGNAH